MRDLDGSLQSLPALSRLGFGAVDPRTILGVKIDSTIGLVLVANLAQPILSFVYFTYNGLFTAMLLGYEWTSYAHVRKGLRVSRAPIGAQRSTYFLQLPYRFVLPLMVISGLIHWITSQSIFLVAFDIYEYDGSRPKISSDHLRSCGFSPIAIISGIILGGIMVIAAFVFGYLPYKTGTNLAGSCSAAMSAACHNEELDGVDGQIAARERLQWGTRGTGSDGVGHCVFLCG